MADDEYERLRTTFDEDAELYDRVRPRYPARLFDDLAGLAVLGPGCRVLEVGCGTGQATVALAQRGCRIVAVELGAAMAAVARRNLAAFPNVDVVVSAFEDWPLPDVGFDVVLSATAWHWINPAVRLTRAAQALRSAGTLVVISTRHIAGGTESFFVDAQACYERWILNTPAGLRLPAADDIPRDSTEINESGQFGPVEFRRYTWEQSYSTEEYLDLLCSYSGHRALAPNARQGLLGSIAELIDSRHGGRISKRYLTEAAIAHRVR